MNLLHSVPDTCAERALAEIALDNGSTWALRSPTGLSMVHSRGRPWRLHRVCPLSVQHALLQGLACIASPSLLAAEFARMGMPACRAGSYSQQQASKGTQRLPVQQQLKLENL